LFEAGKGALVLLAGFGLFGLLHRDAESAADLLSRRLHLNPAKEHARIFVELLSNLSSSRLWMLAGLALTYSCVRFIEAYGLWRNRPWAKWLAALSGAIYVPFELYELYLGVNAVMLRRGNDPQARLRRIPAVFEEGQSEDRPAAQPRNVQHTRGRREA
jgi:uncharacterized membrane protein (DUF2068 family)